MEGNLDYMEVNRGREDQYVFVPLWRNTLPHSHPTFQQTVYHVFCGIFHTDDVLPVGVAGAHAGGVRYDLQLPVRLLEDRRRQVGKVLMI